MFNVVNLCQMDYVRMRKQVLSKTKQNKPTQTSRDTASIINTTAGGPVHRKKEQRHICCPQKYQVTAFDPRPAQETKKRKTVHTLRISMQNEERDGAILLVLHLQHDDIQQPPADHVVDAALKRVLLDQEDHVHRQIQLDQLALHVLRVQSERRYHIQCIVMSAQMVATRTQPETSTRSRMNERQQDCHMVCLSGSTVCERKVYMRSREARLGAATIVELQIKP